MFAQIQGLGFLFNVFLFSAGAVLYFTAKRLVGLPSVGAGGRQTLDSGRMDSCTGVVRHLYKAAMDKCEGVQQLVRLRKYSAIDSFRQTILQRSSICCWPRQDACCRP